MSGLSASGPEPQSLHPVTETMPFVVISLVKAVAVFTVVMVILTLLTLLERKVSAWVQDRLGPNRVGPGGLLQPLATLFLGGWDIPGTPWDEMLGFDAQGARVGAEPSGLKTLLTLLTFALKTAGFVLVFMLARWTLLRLRYDQVMALGWKVMLPAALLALVVTAGTVLALEHAGVEPGYQAFGFLPVNGLTLGAVNFPLLALVLWRLERGRVLTGRGAVPEKQRTARPRLAQDSTISAGVT